MYIETDCLYRISRAEDKRLNHNTFLDLGYIDNDME